MAHEIKDLITDGERLIKIGEIDVKTLDYQKIVKVLKTCPTPVVITFARKLWDETEEPEDQEQQIPEVDEKSEHWGPRFWFIIDILLATINEPKSKNFFPQNSRENGTRNTFGCLW